MTSKTMPEGSPKIAIVCAGAVGAHVGGHLTKVGYAPILVDFWPEHVEAMRRNGLRLTGMTEPECFTQPVEAWHITELEKLSRERPVDIAFVCAKSYDTVWATEMIRQYLAPDGFVVSLQNSINEERIAGVVGWGKVVGTIASLIAVELHAPGEVRRHVQLGGARHTVFRVGEPHGRVTDRAQLVAEMLSHVDSSKATTNLWGERWSKLVINAMRNPMSAATGLGGNEADRLDYTRRLAIRIAGEAIRTGFAHGFALETLYGMEPARITEAAEGSNEAMAEIEDVLERNAQGRAGSQRPSMGQDIQKGRRTEIDHINGLVVDYADRLGLAAPANRAIIEIVKLVERRELAPAPENVRHI
ncbi:MAG: 2-dehydropantoate 2-reductase [Alphaproteobacteria bacterium]|nr:2-dehydropantoate 2-reductase [Alphaproteobacteria bacterium]